jgi:hypothetical protein
MQGDTLIAILSRLIAASSPDLSPAVAQAVLEMRFADSDQQRVDRLAAKSNQGDLSPEEAAEYDEYINAAELLTVWKAKARLALKPKPSAV